MVKSRCVHTLSIFKILVTYLQDCRWVSMSVGSNSDLFSILGGWKDDH